MTSRSVAIVDKAVYFIFSQIVNRWHVFEDRNTKEDALRKRYTPHAPLILARLKELFTGSDPAKQLGAAICLTRLGDRDAGRFLINRIVAGDRAQTRLDVLQVAGYTESEEIVPVLLEFLRGEDIWFAITAAQTLGRIGSKSAVDGLLWVVGSREIKSTEDVMLMEASTDALAQIGDPRAIQTLLKAAGPKDRMQEHLRAAPIQALGHFPGEESLAAIVAGISSHYRQVREAAIEALGTRGDSVSVEWLIKILSREEPSLVSMAVAALGRIGDRRAVSAIVPLLQQKDDRLRYSAQAALMQIGDSSALPALREALNAPANKNDFFFLEAIRKTIESLEGR